MVYERFIQLLKEGHFKALEQARTVFREVLRGEIRIMADYRVKDFFKEFNIYRLELVLWHDREGKLILGGLLKDGTTLLLTSDDMGMTFTMHDVGKIGLIRGGIVTRKGTVILGTTEGYIIRSVDLKKWEYERIVPDDGLWNFTEKDGEIYAGTYPYTCRIIKSVDEGKTWSIIDLTAYDDHVHNVYYDRYEDRFLILTGDTTYRVMETKDFVTFTTLRTGTSYIGIETFQRTPTEGGVLLGAEAPGRISLNPKDLSIELFSLHIPYTIGGASHVFCLKRAGTLWVACTHNQGDIVWSNDMITWNRIRIGEPTVSIDHNDIYVFIVSWYHLIAIRKTHLERLKVEKRWVLKYENVDVTVPAGESVYHDLNNRLPFRLLAVYLTGNVAGGAAIIPRPYRYKGDGGREEVAYFYSTSITALRSLFSPVKGDTDFGWLKNVYHLYRYVSDTDYHQRIVFDPPYDSPLGGGLRLWNSDTVERRFYLAVVYLVEF